jgi:hypothetical protein
VQRAAAPWGRCPRRTPSEEARRPPPSRPPETRRTTVARLPPGTPPKNQQKQPRWGGKEPGAVGLPARQPKHPGGPSEHGSPQDQAVQRHGDDEESLPPARDHSTPTAYALPASINSLSLWERAGGGFSSALVNRVHLA